MIDGFISRRLSSKLLLLTIGFVMLAEMLLFIPTTADYRQNWLTERAQQAGLLAQALTGVPNYEASTVLSEQFMADTDVLLMISKGASTELLLGAPPDASLKMVEIDLRDPPRFPSWIAPFQDIFSGKDEILTVHAPTPVEGQDELELFIPREALGKAMYDRLKAIFWLSLFIAIFTGSLIYFAMSALIIRPVRQLAEDMTAFRENPEHRRDVLRTRSKRQDEIGQLEREFVDMKQSQRAAFRQRERLAGLGLAVAKINHDLRNVLTSALLISDRLSMNPEEKMASMGERLTRTVERGISLTEDVLSYSKAESADPQIQPTRIAFAIGEAAADVIEQFPGTQFRNVVPTDLMVMTDPDHAYRIFHNIFRNAAQAMTAHAENKSDANRRLLVGAELRDGLAELRISDTGPGLPERAKENLFQAFASAQAHSSNTKSTGLGLSISKELAKAQGGDLNLMSSDESGTRFILSLPLAEQS